VELKPRGARKHESWPVGQPVDHPGAGRRPHILTGGIPNLLLRPYIRPIKHEKRPIKPKTPRRKPMTVIAGIRCTDGLVLCADSEYTVGSGKATGAKIAFSRPREGGYSLLMAGAGNMGMFDNLFQKSLAKIDASSDQSLAKITEIIERYLEIIYKKHIYPAPFELIDDLNFSVLIGIWTPDSKTQLFESSADVLNNVGDFDCKGIGHQFAYEVIRSMGCFPLTIDQAEMLAAEATSRAKRFSTYVSGDTAIWSQRESDGHILRTEKGRVAAIDAFFRQLKESNRSLVSMMSTRKLTDEQIKASLFRFSVEMEAAYSKIKNLS